MAETANTEKTVKKSWFKSIKTEFAKIVWPDKTTLAKETAAVIVVSVVLGAIVSLLDLAIKYGIDLIIK